MVIGVTVFAYFMGAMGQMLSKMNSSETVISAYLSDLDDFLRRNKVPPALTNRTTAFMRYVLHRKPLHASDQLLSDLSTPLRTEIVLHMHRETIRNVPFLAGKDPHFVVALVTLLQLEYFAPGDVIVRQGDVGAIMFFVGKGELEVRWRQALHVCAMLLHVACACDGNVYWRHACRTPT
jgi:potassium channel